MNLQHTVPRAKLPKLCVMDEAVSEGPGIVRRIFGNLGLLLGGKAAAGLISLIYIVIAARVLGPEDYGVLVLINYYAMLVGGLIAFPGWHAIVLYGVRALAAGAIITHVSRGIIRKSRARRFEGKSQNIPG